MSCNQICCRSTNYGGFAFAPTSESQKLLNLQNQIEQFNFRHKPTFVPPEPVVIPEEQLGAIQDFIIFTTTYRFNSGQFNTFDSDEFATQLAKQHATEMAISGVVNNDGFLQRQAAIQDLYPGAIVNEINTFTTVSESQSSIASSLLSKIQADPTMNSIILANYNLVGISIMKNPNTNMSYLTYITITTA